MAKFIDLTRTVYGYEVHREGFKQTGDVLQAILSDDAQGYKRVHNIVELDVVDGNLEQALNKVRRWARKEGYTDPIKKASIREERRGAFRGF